MKKLLKNIKSNKGFTMQDVIIALIVLTLFVGTIGGSYIAIYKIQSETKLSTATSLYAIQILENIDKISYDEVKNGMEQNYRDTYQIPEKIGLNIEVNPYNVEDTLKKVKLTISYEFAGRTENLVLEKLKVKEI